MDFLSLEDGTERLSRNVGMELPFYAHKKHHVGYNIHTVYSGMFRFFKNHNQAVDSGVCGIYIYPILCG